MKNLFSVFFVLAFVLPVAAYQAGQQNRANFGAGQQAAVSQQPRAFSNYNQRNWGQGVQTQTVQTQVAGSSVKDFGKDTAQKPIGKTQAPAPKPAAGQANKLAPGAAAQSPAGAPANMDPAAIMQQMQGMMNAMGAQQSGQPAAGKAGQNGTMPAGMPDLSALMGGAMPAATTAPAKK